MRELEPGAIGSFEILVGKEHTADSMGNAGMQVLSTPYAVWMMEAAAYHAVLPSLEEGEGVAGTRIDIRHSGPTAVGRTARAECRLETIEGRRLTFHCVLSSGEQVKAEAHYESMIVDLQRMLERAKRDG